MKLRPRAAPKTHRFRLGRPRRRARPPPRRAVVRARRLAPRPRPCWPPRRLSAARRPRVPVVRRPPPAAPRPWPRRRVLRRAGAPYAIATGETAHGGPGQLLAGRRTTSSMPQWPAAGAARGPPCAPSAGPPRRPGDVSLRAPPPIPQQYWAAAPCLAGSPHKKLAKIFAPHRHFLKPVEQSEMQICRFH